MTDTHNGPPEVPTDETNQAPAAVAENGAESAAAQSTTLRSVYTSTLADILNQLGISLAVSTYQAGKVILVRYDEETETVNTHFRNFNKPMGIAGDSARLDHRRHEHRLVLSQHAGGGPQAGAGGQARRRFSAAPDPCHRRHRHP